MTIFSELLGVHHRFLLDVFGLERSDIIMEMGVNEEHHRSASF